MPLQAKSKEVFMGRWSLFYDGVSTLLGAVIGAGVLGLPYVAAKAGWLSSMVMLLVLGLAVLFMNIMLAQVVLATKGRHQLVGYARIYTGKTGSLLMAISVLVGIYGALIAYTLGIGTAMVQILGGTQLIWGAAAVVVIGILLWQRLGTIGRSESFMSSAKVLLILVVVVWCVLSSKTAQANLTPVTSWTVPFGVVLFALLGTAVIPDIRETLQRHSRLLVPCIVAGSIIVVAVYLLFTTAVVAVTGAATSEVATVSLGMALGPAASIVLNLFAVLAMASAFVALGAALRKTFEEDYGWKRHYAWLATMAVPAASLVFTSASFIFILGMTGAIAGSIDGIIIYAMYRKAGLEKVPFLAQVFVLLTFSAGLFWALMQII